MATPAALDRPPTWQRVLERPGPLATVLALWFFGQSLGPSLLLRSWLFQGLLAGVALALGYGIGAIIAASARVCWSWLSDRVRPAWRLSATAALRVRVGVLALAIGYALYAVVQAVPQHEWTFARLGQPHSSFWTRYGLSLVVAVLVAAVLLVLGWLMLRTWHRLTGFGARRLPRWLAGGLAFVLLAWIGVTTLNHAVLQRTLDGLNSTFAAGDRDLTDAPERPTSPLRSGGPASQVDWADTGTQGRRFLTEGPTVAELGDFAVGRVREPIRVFVGRAEFDTVSERVELALDELERFGAFRRDALLLAIPTGTGWVNEQLVQPLEYFYDGDIATVGIQYSHLPSPIAFLAEADAAGETATALVRAVEARLRGMTDPPRLYVAGESLGSFGGARAFASLDDSRDRVTGALWVGPPETMHLRREAERIRVPGSTQVKPVVGDGSEYLFVNRQADLVGVDPSGRPHSVFLQQADDPVVWWDFDTALRRPDWLAEPLDPAVNPWMEWTPVTTFLQLAVDMLVSNDFDEEHGHLYGTLPLSAWYAEIGPAGWDDAKVERLRTRLRALGR